MTAATNYTVNKVCVDYLIRKQANASATTFYVRLFVADQGYWVASHAYSTGQYVLPATPNGSIYKCTTAGTSGSSAPTWSTTPGATVTDGGTLVWTEQTIQIMESNLPPEASYTGYSTAIPSITNSLTSWAGTQSPGSTTASTGSGPTLTTSNNAAITFGSPTGNQTGVVAGVFLADASTAGNTWFWAMLTNPKTINNGDAQPNFPIGALQLSWS